jgi:uncharacterized protein (DUF427 family)
LHLLQHSRRRIEIRIRCWKCETPYEVVAIIKEYLALYPSRVDAIEVIS